MDSYGGYNGDFNCDHHGDFNADYNGVYDGDYNADYTSDDCDGDLKQFGFNGNIIDDRIGTWLPQWRFKSGFTQTRITSNAWPSYNKKHSPEHSFSVAENWGFPIIPISTSFRRDVTFPRRQKVTGEIHPNQYPR